MLRIHTLLWVLPLMLWGVGVHAAPNMLEDARELLKRGEAEAAYVLLEQHEAERMGAFEFDYLFGLAALETGKPDFAVFALERAVAANPDSAYAHADLAQAYLALGEREAAEAELELAMRLNPDPQSGRLIQHRREMLAREDYAGRGHFNAFLEFGLGYDNNVNSATSSREMVIPAFGAFTFTLGGNSLKLGSDFMLQRGGVSASYPLGGHTSIFGRVTGMQRVHSRHEEFDVSSLESMVGITHHAGASQWLLTVQNQDFQLNGRDYRYTLNAAAQWSLALNDKTQAGLFGQAGKLVYPDADLRNTRRYVGGVFASHGFAVFSQPVLYASFYGGHETAVADGVSHMGHRMDGVRLAVENTWNSRWSSFLALGYEHRRYGGADPLFLKGRVDGQTEASAGLICHLPHGFSVRPTVSYVSNHSNIALNDYDRLESMVIVRKDF